MGIDMKAEMTKLVDKELVLCNDLGDSFDFLLTNAGHQKAHEMWMKFPIEDRLLLTLFIQERKESPDKLTQIV